MLSTKKEIKNYILNSKKFTECKINWVKSGLSNRNYFFESDGKKYILRINKPKEKGKINSLRNEWLFLNFLQYKEIDYAPKSVYFDEKLNIHILTYLEGKKTTFKKLGESCMEDAIKKLHNINVMANEFMEYCNKRGEKIGEPRSEMEIVKKEILNKLKLVDNNEIIIRAKERVLKCLEEDFKNKKTSRKTIYLNHGDPADNLIVQNKLIKIIDWEFVKFTYGPGLVHILAHGRLSDKKEMLLIKYYSKYSGIPLDSLIRKTYREKKMYYLLKITNICYKYSVIKNAVNRNILDDERDIDGIFRRYNEIKK